MAGTVHITATTTTTLGTPLGTSTTTIGGIGHTKMSITIQSLRAPSKRFSTAPEKA